MRRHGWALVAMLPFITGFEGSQAREALDLAFHNLYGADVLAAVELVVSARPSQEVRVEFAYGRKRTPEGTRTLLYSRSGDRRSPRALLVQRPGGNDRIYLSEGTQGAVRPLPAGNHTWPLFGSHFNYDDFRTHSADEYRIEVLGSDQVQGEPCQVLRLRPIRGPYTMLVMWISTDRPVIVRADYFDRKGLFKRYRMALEHLEQHFEWWVPMQDEMLDLRTGLRTTRRIRNIMVDSYLGDEVFSLRQLARGRMPRF